MADNARAKSSVDWEKIELEYRSGILSTREIASNSDVSHTAINKRAKKFGWDRDLSLQIKAKAEALVSRRMVSAEVASQQAATERQVIEAGAERIAQVRGEHRVDIQRVRTLALALLSELEGQTANLEDLAALGELLRMPDETGQDKRNDLYMKIIATPSRIDSAKKLAETLKHAIALEREAYGLDDGKAGQPPGDITISF